MRRAASPRGRGASEGPPDVGGEAPALRLVLTVLLVLITAGLFTPGLEGTFVYDDRELAQRAPATQSVEDALSGWMDPYWEFGAKDSETQRGLWRPLTSLALAVGRAVGGGRPLGYHIVSLLLHIGAVWAAFRLAALLLRPRLHSGVRAECVAAFVALLFAVHPAQVEAVSWISAVNDPLWGFLGLLTLVCYELSYRRRALLGAVFVLFALALQAKEQAVVVLPLALLLDLAARRRPGWTRFAAVVAPVVVWYVARTIVFGSADAGIFRQHGDFGLTMAREITFRIELAGGFVIQTFWPVEPAVFRPVTPVPPEGSTSVLVSGIALVVALAAAGLSWWADRRTTAFGLLMLLIVVAPVLVAPASAGLYPLSDRYLYLGVFGAALFLAAWLAQMNTLLPLVTFGMLAPGALLAITYNSQSRFSDELAFWHTAVEQAPNSPNVRWGAGRAYLDAFERTNDQNMLWTSYLHYLHSLKAVTIYGDGSFVDDTSLPMRERAARLEQLILSTPAEERRLDTSVFASLDDRLQATLGQIAINLRIGELSTKADLDYPLDLAKGAKQIWPDEPSLDAMLAEIHVARGEYSEAKEALGQAIRTAPGSAAAYVMLGDVLGREGDWNGARAALQRAAELEPANDDLRLEFAFAALESGQLDLAATALDVVLERTGRGNVRALVLRAGVENERDRPSDALRWLDEAIAIDPENGYAHKERGRTFAKLGDTDRTIQSFAKACEVLPEDFESHYNFAALMLGQAPGDGATESDLASWERVVSDALVRAYVLSPSTGDEQLLLQQRIEPFLRGSPDRAFQLAMVLVKQNREVLSLYWLQRAIEWRDRWPPADRDDNLVLAFVTAGQLYLVAGQPDEALESFRNGVLTDPNHFSARFELGELLYARGALREAKPHLEKALELFSEAGIAPEMQSAVRGTIERRLELIEAADAEGQDGEGSD
ncbi:MAG: tetratricopeptide repeat protein [Planctomycetota bacterium]